MSSHIHELWDDLELQPLYPELNPDDISARVNAVLDQDAACSPLQVSPRKTPMKRSIKSIVLFAAVLALMAGSVLAVAYRSGVLELFFPNGDTSGVEPYVQTALDTAENEDYRLRVDSCLYDGQNVYAVVTVEALSGQAAEDLMSNKVIAESHREMWGEDMVNGLMKSGSTGPETFHCNFGDYYNEEESDVPMSMGGMGFSGIMALGRLLNGEVSPSGRTVDTWAADFTASPVWNNFGNNGISGGNGVMPGNAYVNRDSKGNYSEAGYYYTDYEEGIYMGYRYYETRGYTDGEQWYRENVVYPFGYGLSYTDFSWEVLNADELSALAVNDENKTDTVTIEVKVTNTGKVAGADVVQLYCDPPEGTLEKSSEEGRYALRLKTDAHTAKAGVADIEFNVDDEVVFTEDPHNEGAAIENRFEGADDQLDTVLSRSDWEGTWPTRTDNRELDDELRAALASTEENNPNEYKDLPLTGQDTDLNAIDLRGLDYDAPEWEEFLNALTFQEMKDLFNRGAFKTYGIMRLNLPETVASDGPVGFTNFISLSETGNVAYASEYVLGSTWSTELAYAMGQCVGEEGAYGDVSGVATPYTGWYAPGLNLHRSPFGGRNFEYFSEDPYLSGFMAAAEIEGAQSKGLVTYMKHFALNEQETYREDNGVASWATEQAIRELYLRPFEIAVKYGEASGIMSSFNRIGTKWTGGDYVLLTDVLRGEWGFTGSVICDFNVNPYMSAKQMIYAGGDLNLTTMRYWMRPDETSAGDVSVLRRAAHNVLYSVINSNAMNGITENTRLRIAAPIWQIVLLSVEAAIVVGLAVWGFFEIRSLLKKQRAERAAQAAAQQTESGGGDDVLRPEIKNVNGGNE